jgi:hypothetical protein
MTTEVIVNEGEPAQVEAPAAEAVSDAAVEIARIEADKEIVIAEIHAETEQTRMEVMEEVAAVPVASLEEGIAECQRNISNLSETMVTSLSEMRTLLEERAPPQPRPPSGADALPEVEAAEAPPAPAPKKPSYKLI